ncbi:MAG: hypothetical protein AABX30_03070 [Nanoarchaeota archaeon]
MKEGVFFLEQLISSLEEAELKLEQAYNTQNVDSFNKIKKFMLQVQAKISEVIK